MTLPDILSILAFAVTVIVGLLAVIAYCLRGVMRQIRTKKGGQTISRCRYCGEYGCQLVWADGYGLVSDQKTSLTHYCYVTCFDCGARGPTADNEWLAVRKWNGK